MRVTLLLTVMSLAAPVLAAEMKVDRDLPFAASQDARQTLDVYAPTTGQNHPVAVWIHGGGWRMGDKQGVHQKPAALVARGFLFVSVNYRFVPQVTVKDQAADIARAIRWVHEHATNYGGSPDTIFVLGHSAGAHLAALVCTDESYLQAEGLSFDVIKGCVPVDTAVYDIPRQLATAPPPRRAIYNGVFGTPEEQRACSPITHVAADKGIPPFLILHVADRQDSRVQSQAFARALQAAGVKTEIVAAEGKDHGTINQDLGQPDDQPTQSLLAFLTAPGK